MVLHYGWWELNLIMEVTKGDDGDMKGFIEEERTHSPKTYFPCQQTSWAARPKLQVLCKISKKLEFTILRSPPPQCSCDH